MKSKVTIGLPLRTGSYSVVLPEPCTYCGLPVAETRTLWEHNLVRGSEGTIKFLVPYCSEHEKEVSVFNKVTIGVLAAAFILGIAVAVWLSDSVRTMSPPWNIVVLLGAVLGPVAIGHWQISPLIKKLVARLNPELRDMSVSESGHWGFEIGNVGDDHNEKGFIVGMMVSLRFVNVESAQRFLAANPNARVIDGMGLVKQINT